MKVYLLAGERSGDLIGAELMKEINAREASEFRGLGGKAMFSVDLQIENWTEKSAKMGFVEVFRSFFWYRKKFYQVIDEIKAFSPDVIVFIDFPSFNLRVAKKLKALGVKSQRVQYISPKIWAWKKGRIKQMAKTLDLVLCLFPFEPPLFEKVKLPSSYVGHPLLDSLQNHSFRTQRENSLIGFFPGSRKSEIKWNLPIMLEFANALSKRKEDWKFEIALSDEESLPFVEEIFSSYPKIAPHIKVDFGTAYSLMQRSRCGIIVSGTATFEASFYRYPHCLVYRNSSILGTFLTKTGIIKVKYAGLLNILAGKEIIPECLFFKAKASHLLETMKPFLYSEKAIQDWISEAEKVMNQFSLGANSRASSEIFKLLKK